MDPGAAFGAYTVVEPLGRGAMGEVYRARDPRLGRDVALKILPQAFASDADRLRRFEREAQALGALNHPNIAAIFGLEEVGSVRALVMELVEGQTLADRLASGALPMADALPVAAQIAAAVEAAHEQGIIHRDLKPANIQVRQDGAVKVLDFGLAKMQAPGVVDADLATVSHSGTAAGVMVGTIAYMSPEQARGLAVDRRTDIWAFGCILLEMLSGRRAFGGASASDTLANILQREPDLEGLPRSTPGWLRELLRRCLQKDPRKRLRDIGDARVEIEERLAGPAADADAVAPPRSRVSAYRMLVWAIAAIGLAAAAILLATPAFFGAADAEAPGFDRIIRLVATPANESGPAISPDGKWVAYLSDASGRTDVWVKFIAGGDAANLTASSGVEVQSQTYIGGLDVSPDGTSIAFTARPPGSPQGSMSTWMIPAPLGGVPRRLLEARNQGMRWSPDGARVCYVRTGGPLGDALWIADADGANAREVIKVQGGRHIHWPQWSRDGRFVYFNYGYQNFNTGPTEIFRVPSDGGSPEPVVRTARRAGFPFPSADGRGIFYSANPDGVELALWWRDLGSNREFRLTNAIGDYSEPYESADGRRLVGTFHNVRESLNRITLAPDSAAALQPLTDGTTGDLDPVWSPDGSRLVFTSSRTGNRSLWSVRPDMKQVVPLTAGNALDEQPAFSPDGRQVAFVSDRGGRRGIWVVDVDGGQPRQVAADNVLNTISWSPDGRRIVYSVGGGEVPSLRILSVADGRTVPVTTESGATAPAWSPAADVIAYLEPQRGLGAFLRLVDSRGRPQRSRLLDGEQNFTNGSVAWSPDGKQLAVVTLPGNTNGTLWILDSEGAPSRRLLDLASGEFVRGVTWSRDGQSLVVGTIRSSGDIYLAERSAR